MPATRDLAQDDRAGACGRRPPCVLGRTGPAQGRLGEELIPQANEVGHVERGFGIVGRGRLQHRRLAPEPPHRAAGRDHLMYTTGYPAPVLLDQVPTLTSARRTEAYDGCFASRLGAASTPEPVGSEVSASTPSEPTIAIRATATDVEEQIRWCRQPAQRRSCQAKVYLFSRRQHAELQSGGLFDRRGQLFAVGGHTHGMGGKEQDLLCAAATSQRNEALNRRREYHAARSADARPVAAMSAIPEETASSRTGESRSSPQSATSRWTVLLPMSNTAARAIFTPAARHVEPRP